MNLELEKPHPEATEVLSLSQLLDATDQTQCLRNSSLVARVAGGERGLDG